MRFKTDENIPLEAVNLLRMSGHDALSVFDQSLAGQPDDRIASVCQQEGRALLRLDTDFSDIRTYPPANYPGLIVLRLARQSAPAVTRVLRRLLEVFATNDCHGRLWIVEHNRIRVRS
jgi:predicted nuclease of predicted toxin-antitoxin system